MVVMQERGITQILTRDAHFMHIASVLSTFQPSLAEIQAAVPLRIKIGKGTNYGQ